MNESPDTMRRDVISAYAASAARIGSWVVVSALVYRYLGVGAFAALAFVRGTIGILNYASVGLAPAMIRLLAEAKAPRPVVPIVQQREGVIEYAGAIRPEKLIDPVRQVYVNGVVWSVITVAVGWVILLAYMHVVDRTEWFSRLARDGGGFIPCFGIGLLIRLISDAPSAVLQTSGRIPLDNSFSACADVLWTFLAMATVDWRGDDALAFVGVTFALSSIALLIARWFAASRCLPPSDVERFRHLSSRILSRLLTFGLLITAAQLADYLYAPTDFVLIAWLLHPIQSAVYGPAVQIDGGLLVLVTGIAAVLLPKAAIAHTSGDHSTLRRYYLRGTLGSGLILLLAAVIVWLASPLIFKLWFNDPMLATQAILPLVLIHTVVGGSSAVGRSILLGMNKVKPFTIAVLIAGVSNVILSFVFVRFLHLGLRGIVLGTICAVVGRCAIWMPWYVRRAVKRRDN